jgi:8-amino-7-oxononanoate synthase
VSPSAPRPGAAAPVVVVTGTDTGVGKTLVAAGLARTLSDRGLEVRALKPVESGVDELAREEEDGVVLARAARQGDPREALDRLGRPLAPPLAAELEDVELDVGAWRRAVEAAAAEADVVLVEGAGGVLSPLAPDTSARELARSLGAAALLVAPDRLGTLTHTLTALEALAAGDVPVLGVVLSAPEEADDSTGTNAGSLRRHGDVSRVATLPRVEGVADAAARLREVAGWVAPAAVASGGGEEETPRRAAGDGGPLSAGPAGPRSGAVDGPAEPAGDAGDGADAPASSPRRDADPWGPWLRGALDGLAERDLLRRLRPLRADSAVHVELGGRELTLFSSNDYLGLSAHPEVRGTVAEAARLRGNGPRGSPLVCGYTESHRALERELAELKGTEEALLFPTGFAANLAVLSALGGDGVTIFSDELNHASIIDGCRLARRRGAGLEVYPHADVEALDDRLAASGARRKLVVTDTVFSMDGDLAPLEELVAVKERHGAMLMVDEAHATLVFGETGAGVAEQVGVSDRIEIQMGTLSKAVGALGGFVATSGKMKSWVLNRGRAYVYSTAPPVPVAEGARAGLRVGREEPSIRRRLWARVDQLGRRLGRDLPSPVVPVVLGDERRALAAAGALLERGFHVVAIRPPTVPPGTSRLRIALSAGHAESDVEALADALEEVL